MNGYDLADEICGNIKNDKDHQISIKDTVRVLSFWGINKTSPTNKIGFVCECANDKLKKIIETALVWGDYSLFDEFVREAKER